LYTLYQIIQLNTQINLNYNTIYETNLIPTKLTLVDNK